ncbi:prepilin peptidase [Specibacter sp. RAF43]|uniref:prepilin peptidase n=1 Tax=Specibacter sp. RAF43 TaxID=3233057 RepID=UPI003F96F4FF
MTRLAQLWAASPAGFVLCLAAAAYLACLAVVLSAIDVRTHRLPNRWVLPAYPVAGMLLAASALAAGRPEYLWRALAGALAVGTLYWLMWAAYPAGMGYGDVKLAGVLGLYLGFLGWTHVVAGTAAGFVVGGLWGLALVVSGRGTVKTHIPFGPSMLAGAVAVMALVPG